MLQSWLKIPSLLCLRPRQDRVKMRLILRWDQDLHKVVSRPRLTLSTTTLLMSLCFPSLHQHHWVVHVEKGAIKKFHHFYWHILYFLSMILFLLMRPGVCDIYCHILGPQSLEHNLFQYSSVATRWHQAPHNNSKTRRSVSPEKHPRPLSSTSKSDFIIIFKEQTLNNCKNESKLKYDPHEKQMLRQNEKCAETLYSTKIQPDWLLQSVDAVTLR